MFQVRVDQISFATSLASLTESFFGKGEDRDTDLRFTFDDLPADFFLGVDCDWLFGLVRVPFSFT